MRKAKPFINSERRKYNRLRKIYRNNVKELYYLNKNIKEQTFIIFEGNKVLFCDFKETIDSMFKNSYRYNVEMNSDLYKALEWSYFNMESSYEIYLKNNLQKVLQLP